jgi:hypothetical protein
MRAPQPRLNSAESARWELEMRIRNKLIRHGIFCYIFINPVTLFTGINESGKERRANRQGRCALLSAYLMECAQQNAASPKGGISWACLKYL